MEIKNKQVKEYYDYLISLINNQNLKREVRVNAMKYREIVEALVVCYEYKEKLDEETIEDLKLDFTKMYILPEELKSIVDNMNKKTKEIKM